MQVLTPWPKRSGICVVIWTVPHTWPVGITLTWPHVPFNCAWNPLCYWWLGGPPCMPHWTGDGGYWDCLPITPLVPPSWGRQVIQYMRKELTGTESMGLEGAQGVAVKSLVSAPDLPASTVCQVNYGNIIQGIFLMDCARVHPFQKGYQLFLLPQWLIPHCK